MYLNYKEFSLEFDPDAFTFELLWRGDVFLAAERMRIVDRAGREHHLGDYRKREYLRPESPAGSELLLRCSDSASGAPELEVRFLLESCGVRVSTFVRGFFHLDGVFHWGTEPRQATFSGRDAAVDEAVLHGVLGPVCSLRDDVLFDRERDRALLLQIPETFRMKFDFERELYAFHFENGLDFGREFGIRVLTGYYEKKFSIPYAPVNRSTTFSTPPVGWMSWYAVQFRASEATILDNARKFAAAFGEYAGKFAIWVDWEWCHQGFDGLGIPGCDIFHPVQSAYPEGLAVVADELKKLGAVPALWIGATNDGQRNEEFLRHPEFVLADTPRWCGRYWIDPSCEGVVKEYIPRVFSEVTEWGFQALKWDCLPITLTVYDEHHDSFSDRSISSDEGLRAVIQAARATVGRDFYMLSCAGSTERDITVGIDFFDAARIGGDVFSWRDFSVEVVNRVFRYYPFHNVCIYTDADNLVLRETFNTPGQARARVSFYGLTGLPVTVGDAMDELDPERMEMLRRIMPIPVIRPGDFCRKQSSGALKVVALSCLREFGEWLVAGFFNAENEPHTIDLSLSAELRLAAGRRYALFDFWRREFLGIAGDRIRLDVPAMDVRVLRITPLDEDVVTLIYSSRHITQGGVEIDALTFDAGSRIFAAATRCVAGETAEYALRLPERFRPAGKNGNSSSAEDGEIYSECVEPIELEQEGGILRVRLTPRTSGVVEWKIHFPSASTPEAVCGNSPHSQTAGTPRR